MGKQKNLRLIRYLPVAVLATFLVVVAPLLLVLLLRMSGAVASAWVGALIGVVISFLASYAGAAFWKTRTDSRDFLFSELMLWGWVQRWRSERRLSAAADLLGLTTGRPKAIPGGRLTNEQKAGLLTQLISGLEARDPYTHGHSRRVARHAANIAKRMGLSGEEVAKIRAAGAMHDVGKVDTPIEVLHKEDKLTDGEYAIVKRHPVDGAVMVSMLEDDELTAMVRHHHERLDGTGYPDRVAGTAIPVGARIIAVADTFDAITSTRPYRQAHAHKKALDILVAEAGTQLDPDAVRAFCRCYSGRRPLAYWTILVHGRPRLASMLGGGLGTAKAAGANLMTAAATVAAVGGTALGSLVDTPRDSARAVSYTPGSSVAAETRQSQDAVEQGGNPSSQGKRLPGRERPRHDSKPKTVKPAVPAALAGPDQDGTAADVPSVSAPQPDHPAPADVPSVSAPQPDRPAPTVAPEEEPRERRSTREDRPTGQDDDAGENKGTKPGQDGKGKGKGEDKGQEQGNGPDKHPGKGPDSGKGVGRPQDDKDVGNGQGIDKGNGHDKSDPSPQGKGNGNAPDKSQSPGAGKGPDQPQDPAPAPPPSSPPGQVGGTPPGGPPLPGGNGNPVGPPALPGGNGNGIQASAAVFALVSSAARDAAAFFSQTTRTP